MPVQCAVQLTAFNITSLAGMRFGLLQTKVGLISLLSSYEVQVSEKTPIPLVFDPRALVLSHKGEIYLKIVERSDSR
jgi:cytochrome P450 family 6